MTTVPWTKGEAVRHAIVAAFGLLVVVTSPDGSFYLIRTGWLAVVVNLLALAGSLFLMRWRRARPVWVTVVIVALAFVFPLVWAVSAWAYVSLSTHRQWRKTVGVGLFMVLMQTFSSVFAEGAPNIDVEASGPVPVPLWLHWLLGLGLMTLSTVALAAIGSYLGARRDADAALQDRLALLEREQTLVREASRSEERNRIAREMHDVLAHKISLISMHAGALAYRDDLSPEETRAAAQTIQESSHQALNELRTILGQLRQMEGGDAAKPQPTLAALDELVAEHRTAGGKVSFTNTLDGEPPLTVSRHAYRVIQECLTNARKHAPGTSVTLDVAGDSMDGIRVKSSNPISVAGSGTPGSGLGLIGLEERVELVGGKMTVTREPEFSVEVWLPW